MSIVKRGKNLQPRWTKNWNSTLEEITLGKLKAISNMINILQNTPMFHFNIRLTFNTI